MQLSHNRRVVLAGLMLLVMAVSVAGGLVTAPKIPTWYAGLNKPSFNPPGWLFGPVWTALYISMGFAAWRVWFAEAPEAERRRALMWFFIQLALNAIWSPVFFGLENPRAALVIVIALWLSIVMTVAAFFRVDRSAGLTILPYLAWVSFASALNAAIAWLN